MSDWNIQGGSPQVINPFASMSDRDKMGYSLFNRPPTFTQINPYTSGWMGAMGNEQNMLNQMLFGGGGGGGGGLLSQYLNPGGPGGLLSQYLNPMSEGGFMSQFLSTAPQLQNLTRSASDAELERAMTLGREGQEAASAGFSGLGAKYSGANLLAGNKAYQDAMGDLSGKIASENFAMLNNLYGNTLNQYGTAWGQGVGMDQSMKQSLLGNLFNLYGLNAGNLAGAAVPMFQANPTMWDNLGKLLGAGGTAAAGAGSLISALK